MKFPEQFRRRGTDQWSSNDGDDFGAFIVPDACDRLLCIVSSGAEAPEGLAPWEHVSVSVRNKRGLPLRRCPTWAQMCKIKDLFWDAEEAAMQLHPPRSDYVSSHDFCLHLWRPVGVAIPLPPSVYVGLKDVKVFT